jgi:hypothetical protein
VERVDSGVAGMTFDHDLPVMMNDGLKLGVNIYRMEKPGRYPVLMDSYGKDTRLGQRTEPLLVTNNFCPTARLSSAASSSTLATLARETCSRPLIFFISFMGRTSTPVITLFRPYVRFRETARSS